MPIKDEANLSSQTAVFNCDYRLQVRQPTPGHQRLDWGIVTSNGPSKSSLYTEITLVEIPEFMRPQLQDWIDLAQNNQPSTEANP